MPFSQDDYIRLARELGRSDDLIKDTSNYAQHLVDKKLPVIFSSLHLSLILGINYNELKEYTGNRTDYYKFYQIRKRNGGHRQILSPHNNLKTIQHFIATEILSKVPVHQNATGFTSNKSILNNAQPHANKEAILNIDLLKFFDTITERRVYGIFSSLGYAKNLAVNLAKLCTAKLPIEYLKTFTKKELESYEKKVPYGSYVVPQGAPTSPILSNLILRNLDKRLTSLSLKQGVNYTRYADDITFSGKLENLPKFTLLKQIISDEGMNVNWNKVGIYKKGRKQMVTGLTISNDIHIPKAFKKEVAKHIYGCLNFGVDKHIRFMNLEDKSLYKEWLLGKIYFINSIEPTVARKMMNEFNRIIWPI